MLIRFPVILSVELGHVFCTPVIYPRPPRNSPSRQRRQDRRAAARHSAEEASKEDAHVEEKEDFAEPLTEKVKEPIEEGSSAEQVTSKPCENSMIIPDEVCHNEDYEIAPVAISICSVELFPQKYTLDGLEDFRAKIGDYFRNRTDVIKRVIKWELENYGNNVKLVTEMKVKRGWSFFFFDQEENYPDLKGVKTIRHAFKDLSNCD
jgi:hypothetical protein